MKTNLKKAVFSQLSVSPKARPFGLFAVFYFGMAALQPLLLRCFYDVRFRAASLFMLLATTVLAQTAVLIILAIGARSDFGWRRLLAFKPRAFFKGLLVCGPMPLLLLLPGLSGSFPGLHAISSLLRVNGPAPLLLLADFFLCIAILTPVLEEVAMRGFLQTSFLKYYKPTAAVILTALCFSLMHWEQHDLLQMLYSFLLGVLFSLWRLREETLWTAIGGHMAFNASAFVVSVLLLDLPKDVLAMLRC